MKFFHSTCLLGLAMALTPLASAAQAPGSVKIASVAAAAAPATVARGSKGTVVITVAVKAGYHINSHKPNDPDLIATTFTPTPTPGVTFGPVRYPSAKSIKVSYEKQPMTVYEGKAKVIVPFTVSKSAKPGHILLHGDLGYQGCNSTSCYPPTSAPVKASLTIK